MKKTKKIIEEQFCTYEISKKILELGFREQCFAYFSLNVYDIVGIPKLKPIDTDFLDFRGISQPSIPAPLWQQAIDFFIKYKIFVNFKPTRYNENGQWELIDIDFRGGWRTYWYEHSLGIETFFDKEEVFNRALNIIKNKKESNFYEKLAEYDSAPI